MPKSFNFSIDGTTAYISVSNILNFDEGPFYRLTIKVSVSACLIKRILKDGSSDNKKKYILRNFNNRRPTVLLMTLMGTQSQPVDVKHKYL